jgi:hypothetical protein
MMNMTRAPVMTGTGVALVTLPVTRAFSPC